MGRPKLLLPWGGTTVLGSLVEALVGGGVETVVVVTAPSDDALRRWCGSSSRIRVAVNPAPERGMLSSVIAGLESLGDVDSLVAGSDPLLVCPGDHPALGAETITRLLTCSREAPDALTVPVFDGRRGHPLVIAAARVPEVFELDPAVGLRQLLGDPGAPVVEVPVEDPGILANVNTPEDYRRLTGTPPR